VYACICLYVYICICLYFCAHTHMHANLQKCPKIAQIKITNIHTCMYVQVQFFYVHVQKKKICVHVCMCRGAPTLSILTLQHNPVSSLPHARLFSVYTVKGIHVLDGVVVGDKERARATVCVCVCIHIHIQIYICIYMYMYQQKKIVSFCKKKFELFFTKKKFVKFYYICIYVFVYMCICVCICVYVYIYICVSVYVYIYMCVC